MKKIKIGKRRVGEGIYERTDAKGSITFYVSYRDIYSKQKWVKIGKKSDGISLTYCKQFRSKIINQKYLGEDASKDRNKSVVLFEELAQDYFIHAKHAGHKRPQQPIRRYELHIKNKLGHLPADSITKVMMDELIIELKAKGLANATVDRIRQQVCVIFNVGIHHDKCKKNPAQVNRSDNNSLMRFNKKGINNARERFLSKEESALLLEELLMVRYDVYVMALIALTTGARAGEILAIQYKDINFDSKYITLPETKNGDTRKILMVQKVYDVLRELEFDNPNHYLFPGTTKPHLEHIPEAYQKVANRLFNQGLEIKDSRNRVVFHTLRHTTASLLSIAGTPIYTIKDIMGHKSIEMTMRYAKLSPDVGAEAVTKLADSLLA